MCEPCHSIVQFNDPDDHLSDDPGRQIPGEGNLWAFGKKVVTALGSWFHISKMGRGHSEALHATGLRMYNMRDYQLFETDWWNRHVHFDAGQPYRKREEAALEAAVKYSNAVSIGDIRMLRRFLEASVVKSMDAVKYHENFELMLTAKGREKYYDTLRSAFGRGSVRLGRFRLPYDGKERLVKCMLGLTRKRQLLIPEWADVPELWTPAS